MKYTLVCYFEIFYLQIDFLLTINRYGLTSNYFATFDLPTNQIQTLWKISIMCRFSWRHSSH